MAFSDFTFSKLKKKYNLLYEECQLFESNLPSLSISQKLTEDIEESKLIPLYSEKAKSEAIIFPIIKEVRRNNPNITIFSGVRLQVENEKELHGIPDFMISAKPKRATVEAPIFCMLEAKNGILEDGFAQCAAEMLTARLFNQENDEPYETIYGAVTNAYDWVFMKLENNTIFIDSERYFLNDLPRILGIMQFIVEQYR